MTQKKKSSERHSCLGICLFFWCLQAMFCFHGVALSVYILVLKRRFGGEAEPLGTSEEKIDE